MYYWDTVTLLTQTKNKEDTKLIDTSHIFNVISILFLDFTLSSSLNKVCDKAIVTQFRYTQILKTVLQKAKCCKTSKAASLNRNSEP